MELVAFQCTSAGSGSKSIPFQTPFWPTVVVTSRYIDADTTEVFMEGTLLLHVNYGKAMSNGKYKSILHRAVMNKAINLSI